MNNHLSLQTLLQQEYADLDLETKQEMNPNTKNIIFNNPVVKPKIKKKLRKPKRPFSSKKSLRSQKARNEKRRLR